MPITYIKCLVFNQHLRTEACKDTSTLIYMCKRRLLEGEPLVSKAVCCCHLLNTHALKSLLARIVYLYVLIISTKLIQASSTRSQEGTSDYKSASAFGHSDGSL